MSVDPSESQRLSDALEAAAMQQLVGGWKSLNIEYFHEAMRLPTLELTDAASKLGFYDPRLRRIVLARGLLFEQPWGVVIEVLKHEMAHQYVFEVLRVTDETAHGRAFQQVCARLGVDAASSGLPEAQPRSEEEERVLGRIARLLALADSPNEHEAQAAMNAAQKLMLKHNLSACGERPRYQFRHLGSPSGRIQESERWLANILSDHFFVETIWVATYDARSAKRGSVLEICGSTANLEMACYVHAFLRETAERLWLQHKQKKNIRANRDRQKFLAGVMLGFLEKLREQERSHMEEGLVWVKDGNLDDYFRQRHPRVRTVRYNGGRPSEAYAHGREAGRTIVLHRPMSDGPSGGVRLLGPKS